MRGFPMHRLSTTILLLLLVACSRNRQLADPAAFEAIVEAHTSGIVSRESVIRVRFVTDVVNETQIGTPLDRSPFTFAPSLSGVAVWTDHRSLEFRPADRLPSGKTYTVFLALKELMEVPRDLSRFEFKFATLKPSLSVTLEGLRSPSANDVTAQELQGTVTTADTEDGLTVEQTLTARQEGRALQLVWRHATDGRSHFFTAQGITLTEAPSSVTVSWDGTPIGSDEQGELLFELPAAQTFVAMSARAVQDQTDYIEVRFSHPLQADQLLSGLVRVTNTSGRAIEPNDLRYEIQDNIARLYNVRGWKDDLTVSVDAAVRNALRERMARPATFAVSFTDAKPLVRFIGKGVILPTTQNLTVPFEAVNLKAVTIEAIRVFDTNVPQFLQVNALDGENELYRVGRIIWKKTVPLNYTPDKRNKWIRYGLDVAPLIKDNPAGLYRLTVSFKRSQVISDCPTDSLEDDSLITAKNESYDAWEGGQEPSLWDNYGGSFDWDEYYNNRENPCHPAYYVRFYDHNIAVSKNVLVSDVGLLAKRGSSDEVFVAATNLRDAKPLFNTEVSLLDFQQQTLVTGRTNGDGVVKLRTKRQPFLVIAKNGNQVGYLKLDTGSALSVSHFDVAGETVEKGLKGFLYGERGVWRPGDPIFLTFILHDPEHTLPANHPVLFELHNARGQLVQSVKRTSGFNGFYTVRFETGGDAPTGNWIGRVKVGGATFEKVLKIATVMPNRLKVGLTLASGSKRLTPGVFHGELKSQWLHGATARNLKSDIKADYSGATTSFPKYETYLFDDPLRTYQPESQTVFEGRLNESGVAGFTATLQTANRAPGRLTARFTTRVFEEGGAFSVDQLSVPYDPYKRYIGLRTPEGDKARGMLLTDTTQVVDLVALDPAGAPVAGITRVEVRLFKVEWRWWWEKGTESLVDYVGTPSHQAVQADTVRMAGGRGTWRLRVNYPEWGRYLLHIRDLDGDHATGKLIYLDWPGWAGRGQRANPSGATVLSLSADKETYKVGERVTVTIPTAKEGRGLVSLETGSRILKTEWIDAEGEDTRYTFEAQPEMAPNVYVHATFLQPHLNTTNDLPIRLYGVIPVKIADPNSRIEPRVTSADVFAPESRATIRVSETSGRPMTYTVAVVDQGLLSLTRFETPDPWAHFFKREALGVRTWDLFDEVAGAYGGAFDRLLSIGGDDKLLGAGQNNRNRFPPMVQFIGPFELKRGATNTHEIDLPHYVGEARIMVVAGQEGAFGSTEKAVPIRKPLMVLGTLPRVLGPEESVELPISVFAMENRIKAVDVSVTVQGPVTVDGPRSRSIAFTETGDQIVLFRLKTGSGTGIATVSMEARSGQDIARQAISIGVRLPSKRVTETLASRLTAGSIWSQQATFPGLPGTNTATLELARIPPLNLSGRLAYLVGYPNGCIEQIVSRAFAQLYLNDIMDLSTERQDEIEKNIKAAIDQLRGFQTAFGGFSYWPGESEGHFWASNYAGHFLVEAQKKGYTLPNGVLSQWAKFQRTTAVSWSPGPGRADLIQAYRLYTLALSGEPELGAMNRLREQQNLSSTARWRLAATYQLAGQPEAAKKLAQGVFTFDATRELSDTFGSPLRDKAMMLEAIDLLNQPERAAPLATELSDALSSDQWLSTQETAYALLALIGHSKLDGGSDDLSAQVTWAPDGTFPISSSRVIDQRKLSIGSSQGGTLVVRNTGRGTLYPRLILEGIPAVGQERASQNGLALTVTYQTGEGKTIDVASTPQGTDLIAQLTVRNTDLSRDYKGLALTYLIASGWEIRSERLTPPSGTPDSRFDYQDIRDDRAITYFDLKHGETKSFRFLINTSYLGRYYLPLVSVEAMYDGTVHATLPGRWTEVVRRE